MAQISYGTITITDTTDIERIYPVYCKGNETNTPSLQPLTNWSENVSQAGGTGDYIWQRIVTKKQGIAVTANDYSDAVRLTGDDGTSLTITNIQYAQTQHENDTPSYGSSMPSSINEGWWLWVKTTYSDGSFVETKVKQGQTGVSVTATRELYWLKTNSTNPSQITWNSSTSQPSQTIYSVDRQNSWTSVIPTYIANGTYYTCIETTLSNSTKTWSIPAINNGLTNANRKAFEAANAAEAAAANAEASAVAAKAAQAATKWFVHNDTGSIVIAGREDRDFKENDINTYGYNAITAPGYIALRNNGTQLATFATNSLTFYRPNSNIKMLELTPEEGLKMYNPTTLNQELMSLNNNILSFKDLTGNILASFGNNGIIQSGNYSRGNNSIYAQTGTQINLVDGEIFSPYFRISDGVGGNNEPAAGAYIQGIVNANEGRIGDDSTNYWYIGRYYDYLQQSSAIIKSHGTSFIQLGEDNTWRLSTDRIHTGWVNDNGDETGRLHFLVDNNYYWDLGLHIPNSTNNKFMYIRRASSSESLDNLITDLNDTSGGNYWDYQFYVDKQGNLYANNLYFKNQEGTWSLISGSDSIYLPLSGGIISGNLSITGTLTKGDNTVTYLTTTPTTGRIIIADGTSGGLKTSSYTIAKSVPSNAIFTDENVATTEANTTKIWLVGTNTSGNHTGKLNYDSNIYADVTAGALHATTFNGYTLAAASARGVDASINTNSNNLPTTTAVINYVTEQVGNIKGDVTGVKGSAETEYRIGNVNITKANIGLGNVENKSSATIRGELTKVNVTNALGFTPYDATNPNGYTSNEGTVVSVSTDGPITGGTFSDSGTIGHATSGVGTTVTSTGLYKFKYNQWGHITGVSAITKSDITGLGIPAQDTTYSEASSNIAGLMSAADKQKLDSIQVSSEGKVVAANIAGRYGISVVFDDNDVAQVGHSNSAITASNTKASKITSSVTSTQLNFSDVINFPYVAYDSYGHITSKTNLYFKMPEAPSSAANATNDSDGNPINTTYIKKSIGTAAGDIIYWSGTNTPTRLAKGSNGQVLKLANGVPSWGTDNNTTYTFASGATNGAFTVTPSGGTAQTVSIHGLGSLAYKSSLAASDIPNISTDKLTSGTLPTSRGGTGNTAFTANRLTYAETATKQSSAGGLSYYTGTSTASTPATYTRLHIHGTTYGNDAATMLSGTAGAFRFGDGGPQITFDTSATSGGAQAGALIFTDHDSAGSGVSFHFVSNQSPNNNGGSCTVTAPRFRARVGLAVGQNSDNTSHALYVNGSAAINGNTLKVINNSNTVTIGSQNTSFTHIYNSVSIPFIFNNSILTTSGSLGSNSYPFTNVNITGGYNMLVGNTQKANMHYDSSLDAIVFSFA